MGGPARQDAPKAVEALKKLNVPYLVSLPLVFQTTEEWLDSELGVHPVQVALQVRPPASPPPPPPPLALDFCHCPHAERRWLREVASACIPPDQA